VYWHSSPPAALAVFLPVKKRKVRPYKDLHKKQFDVREAMGDLWLSGTSVQARCL